MPCTDGRENLRTEYVEHGNQTARLCAVFTVLERDGLLAAMLAKADWKEAGVSRKSTEEWWERHKEEDRVRRKREAVCKDVEEARRIVLSRLSLKERKILGIK